MRSSLSAAGPAIRPPVRNSARYFGTSARFWMNLQARYDLEVEKDRLGDSLEEIQPLSAAGADPGT
jgi:plasmid maintenance system antidote protein VapI